jgi:hypothetical protein
MGETVSSRSRVREFRTLGSEGGRVSDDPVYPTSLWPAGAVGAKQMRYPRIVERPAALYDPLQNDEF